MITIDQLLESVDLDFEPRFVTKDEEEDVIIWEGKPKIIEGDYLDYWSSCGRTAPFEKLRVAEFANKKWQECIYEVPRKTTGKLKHIERIDDSFVDKINAIIDTVMNLWATSTLQAPHKHPTSTPQVKGAKNE